MESWEIFPFLSVAAYLPEIEKRAKDVPLLGGRCAIHATEGRGLHETCLRKVKLRLFIFDLVNHPRGPIRLSRTR